MQERNGVWHRADVLVAYKEFDRTVQYAYDNEKDAIFTHVCTNVHHEVIDYAIKLGFRLIDRKFDLGTVELVFR